MYHDSGILAFPERGERNSPLPGDAHDADDALIRLS